MLLLGIDLGTSSIKVSVVDATTRNCLASAQFPETEADIISPQPGWAEQSPDLWWEQVRGAILKCNATRSYDSEDIAAIGIAYQMHGLVLVDKDLQVLRNAIIWCDSRAIGIGERAFHDIGESKCLSHLLNSPGNFTASKLAWVKKNEPQIYERINRVLLPGDFIAMKFTGAMTTTISALSEGIFWDYPEGRISGDVLHYFDFDASFFPELQPVFSEHGRLSEAIASGLSLRPGIPVTYKAGDQPNNALSLNVLQPGELAATAGTSGVIYGVSDQLECDPQSRINSFAHVNHAKNRNRIGILLCINGAGIFNRWIKNTFAAQHSYETLNREAAHAAVGSNGLFTIPFGNGAERMLNNTRVGAHFSNLDFTIHSLGHIVRSTQEGIAFAFRYGLDIMKENGIQPSIIRAGKANMFLSEVFTRSFVNATGVPVELHQCDGSLGAAMGAGIGAGAFAEQDLAGNADGLETIEPSQQDRYEELYQQWKVVLDRQLGKGNERDSLVSKD
jgi:xylulokinase